MSIKLPGAEALTARKFINRKNQTTRTPNGSGRTVISS